MKVVAIGTDGTRSEPYTVHPRSPLAKEIGGRTAPGTRVDCNGMLYEIIDDRRTSDER